MTRPNLSDKAQWYAYKQELHVIALVPRRIGFVLTLVGVGLWFWARFFGGSWYIDGFQTVHLGWGMIAIGWALFAYVITVRTRYHKRRMAEPPL